MGRIRRQILDDINGKLNRKLNITLWKNSAAVIEWFRSTEMKESCTFTSFNIIEFSPSISEDLLNRAIRFANNHIDTGDDEVATIQHSTKFLLFSKNKARVQKEDPGLFDVALGSYDGAEVCELVEIFVLSHLPE